MSQKDALLEIFSNGVGYDMDSLVDAVENHTGKAAKRSSLMVHISNIRKAGYNIESTRTNGVLTYKLKGAKGRKRQRAAVTA